MAIIAKFTRTLPAPSATISGGFVFLLSAGWFTDADQGAAGSPIDGGANSLANGGGDMQIFSDTATTTQLPIEVVSFVTGGSPVAQVWVRTPSYTAGDTITIGKDDTQTAQPAVGAVFGRDATWVDFKLVCHFEEGAAGSYVDSSGNQPDGAITLGSITTQQGVTGTEIIFNGGSTVGWNVNSDLESQADLLLSVLCSPTDNLANQLCGNFNGDAGSNTNDVRIDAAGAESGNPRFLTTHQVGANSSAQIGASWVNGDNIWYNYKYEGSVESKIIMDGTVRATTAQTGSMGGGTADFVLGSKSGSSDRYVGSVAELRMATTLPSDDVSLSEYTNQSDPDNFGTSSEYILVGGSGITVTPDTLNSISVSLDPGVVFNSALSLTPLTVNSNSITLDPSITFAASLELTPDTINSSSISLDPFVQFGGTLDLTPAVLNTLSVALNPAIEFTSALVVTPQTLNSSSISVDPSIEFKSVINLTPDTLNSLSISLNPLITTGAVQTIGVVTAGFADDLYSVKYKLSGITVNFKE